mgnify:CR=1 FL=1
MNNDVRPPLIVIGMHRSGTSMITRMLERLGLFLGTQRDPNDESRFFLEHNRWLLRQSGGAWDHPTSVDHLLDQPDVRTLYADYLRYMLKTRGRIAFLGIARALKGEAPLQMTQPWGWKDPRNTFTLPLWMDLFPDARIIHIYRHGIDVARSLRKREQQVLRQSQARHKRRKWLYWARPKKHGFLGSPRCLSLLKGVQLWDAYTSRAHTHTHALGERAYTLQYEDFLQSPASYLRQLAVFCRLEVSDDAIQRCVRHVDASRAYAYQAGPDVDWADGVGALLQKHGYSAEP